MFQRLLIFGTLPFISNYPYIYIYICIFTWYSKPYMNHILSIDYPYTYPYIIQLDFSYKAPVHAIDIDPVLGNSAKQQAQATPSR